MNRAVIRIWSPLLLLLLLMMLQGCGSSSWWRGNLHTHSYWSDGNTYPEEIAAWYKLNGYNFLVVSDHNRLQEGERWRKRAEGDSIRLLPLEEYRSDYEEPQRFLLIHGEEVSDASQGKPVHLNAIYTSKVIQPTGGVTVGECLLNNVVRMREEMTPQGFGEWIMVNHPNFGWALNAEDLALSTARFFEVFNGHPAVRNWGDSIHPSTEELWDEANRYRAVNGLPLLLGTATDDAHHYHKMEPELANPGRGWVQVRSADLSPEALYQAMIEGQFYATTGVEIDEIKISRRSYRIKVRPLQGFSYKVQFFGILEKDTESQILAEVSGTEATYEFSGKELFVRSKILSDKVHPNPFSLGETEMAWTQPVKVSGSLTGR